MKKKIILIIASLVIIISLFTIIIILKPKEEIDENMLYKNQFDNIILKFRRYDYALGQNMVVGVEKSTDKGKNYTLVTKETITVSNEAKFIFLNENLGFAISTGYVRRYNDFLGLKVTKDGGETFQNAKFNYDNNRIDLITIEDFPYFDENKLKLKCSVYDIKPDGDGYQDIELLFTSEDNGLTWEL